MTGKLVECDGGFACPAVEHIEGCYTGEGHPDSLRPEVWRCEYCGRFYSARTAKAHAWCQQEQDRKDAEGMWPDA